MANLLRGFLPARPRSARQHNLESRSRSSLCKGTCCGPSVSLGAHRAFLSGLFDAQEPEGVVPRCQSSVGPVGILKAPFSLSNRRSKSAYLCHSRIFSQEGQFTSDADVCRKCAQGTFGKHLSGGAYFQLSNCPRLTRFPQMPKLTFWIARQPPTIHAQQSVASPEAITWNGQRKD